MCASVCTRLNKNAFLQSHPADLCIFKGASVVLDFGFQAGYLCWMKCVWIYEWRSYHRSNWGAKLGNRAGEIWQRGQDVVRQRSGGLCLSRRRSPMFFIVVKFGSSPLVVESVNNPSSRYNLEIRSGRGGLQCHESPRISWKDAQHAGNTDSERQVDRNADFDPFTKNKLKLSLKIDRIIRNHSSRVLFRVIWGHLTSHFM